MDRNIDTFDAVFLVSDGLISSFAHTGLLNWQLQTSVRVKDFCLKFAALTVLYVPYWLVREQGKGCFPVYSRLLIS